MQAVGGMARGVVLACLVVCLVISVGAVAAAPSPAYLALLEAAKAEGKAVIGGFAFDPDEIATLEKGFKKRFGFAVKLTHDPTHIRDIPPKVIAGGFDVVEVNVAGGHQILASPRGLVQVEWSMFAHEFPPHQVTRQVGQDGGRLYHFPRSCRLEAQRRGHQGGRGDFNWGAVNKPLCQEGTLR